MTHRIPVDWRIEVWSDPKIVLHQDGIWFLSLFAWAVIGTALYLSCHGLAYDRPKPFLTLICGPSAYILGIYKRIRIKYVLSTPPPVPKKWTVPRGFERG